MADRVILTERREELLSGEYDPDDSADRMAKSRLKNSAETALDELTQIAKNPHIDQTDIFDPDDVFRFLRAVKMPTQDHLEPDEFVNIPSRDKYTDEFAAYTDRLQLQMSKLVLEEDETVASDDS